MNLAAALVLWLVYSCGSVCPVPCVSRAYGHGSVVCVCDGGQCGPLEPRTAPRPPSPDGTASYALYTSTKAGLRLHRADGNFTNGYARPRPRLGAEEEAQGVKGDADKTGTSRQSFGHLSVDALTTYQKVDGFGGAITDSAAINIHKLSPRTRDVLLRALFGTEGNAYNLVRVPMGGTDDSLRKYTYADRPSDAELRHFQLAEEDLRYKIPVLLNASALAAAASGGDEVRVMASAWTAPPWMKSNGNFVSGTLRRDMYQPWADYHVRFLEEYAARGVAVWALTTGNEPINAFVAPLLVRFNSMGWTPIGQRRWVGRHLGPTLRRSRFNATRLLALDDQRMLLPWWLDIMFRDPGVSRYVDGVAVHWYWDIVDPSIGLDFTHNHFPDKFIISTEASSADKPWDLEKVQLGSWSRAERYMRDILKDMNHWVTGWMEWSLVLDRQGGPTWSRNFVDVSVIVDPVRDEFLLQPTYFAMAHFSRFVPRGSVRVRVQLDRHGPFDRPADEQGLTAVMSARSDVEAIAFRTPTDCIVVIMHNAGDSDTSVTLRDPRFGVAGLVLPARSFNTLVYSGEAVDVATEEVTEQDVNEDVTDDVTEDEEVTEDVTEDVTEGIVEVEQDVTAQNLEDIPEDFTADSAHIQEHNHIVNGDPDFAENAL